MTSNGMKRFTLAIFIGILGLVIAILHVVAINLYFYWDIWWFDIVMHFLGGFWVALLGIWVLAFFTKNMPILSWQKLIGITIFFSVSVGVLWEIFEALSGLSFVATDFWLDTIIDICLDAVGGAFAGVYLFSKQKNVPKDVFLGEPKQENN